MNSKHNKGYEEKRVSETIAIAGLLLNTLVLPGLGSIIAERTKEGTWQIILSVLGLILSLVLIGIPIIIGAYIWAIITSIDVLKNAKN